MTTFSTNGYGDFTSQNEAEVIWSICYMMWNLGLSAYILGTSVVQPLLPHSNCLSSHHHDCKAVHAATQHAMRL